MPPPHRRCGTGLDLAPSLLLRPARWAATRKALLGLLAGQEARAFSGGSCKLPATGRVGFRAGTGTSLSPRFSVPSAVPVPALPCHPPSAPAKRPSARCCRKYLTPAPRLSFPPLSLHCIRPTGVCHRRVLLLAPSKAARVGLQHDSPIQRPPLQLTPYRLETCLTHISRVHDVGRSGKPSISSPAPVSAPFSSQGLALWRILPSRTDDTTKPKEEEGRKHQT